jgi:acyl-CoA synthetase (AMP-forming)/AMP-acid ligase II
MPRLRLRLRLQPPDGHGDEPVTAMDFPSLLRKSCRMYRDNIVATFEGSHQTYAQLMERSCRLANALAGLGLRPGDRVALLSDNRLESVEHMTGLAMANVVRAPLYAQNPAPVHAYMLNLIGASACIVDGRYAGLLLGVRDQVDSLKHVIVMDEVPPGSGALSYEDLLSAASAADPMTSADPGDNHVIRFSAGTTGRPKGIVHTTAGWLGLTKDTMLSWVPLGEGEAYLAAAPMTHAAGLRVWEVITRGARHVIMPGFDPERFLQAIERERCTQTLIVPTMVQMLAAVPNAKRYDLSSMKAVFYGGAPISDRTLRAGLELWGNIMHQLYGQSEVLGGCILTAQYHRPDGTERERRWLRSAGRPGPGALVTVRDDDGNELPRGETGEICINSPGAMKEIWNDPEATASRFTADGAVRTRDMGYMDEDEFLYIVDRKEDLIISGGFNVWPLEIENALTAHPAVAEAAAVGIPDDKWGEVVAAAVTLAAGQHVTEDELIEFARAAVGPVKRPKHVVIMDAPLPKSPVGKVLRRQVRDAITALHDK